MEKIGKAVMVDFWGCSRKILNDVGELKFILEKASLVAGATPLKFFCWLFYPQGITAGWILAESHIIIHTFPEKKMASVDFYTCGEEANPLRSLEFLKISLQAKKLTLQEARRPLPQT